MRLSDWLASKKLSEAEFARRIGVEPKSVRRYIDGSRAPRDEHMRAILDETGGAVTPNDFFEQRIEQSKKRRRGPASAFAPV